MQWRRNVMKYRIPIQAMHQVSHQMTRVSARVSEVSDRVGGQVSHVTERVHHATQRAVLPITITCTVALSSGAAALTHTTAGRQRTSSSPSASESVGRARERSVKPRRPVRPRHYSARPKAETTVRARAPRAAMTDVQRVSRTLPGGSASKPAAKQSGARRRSAVRERFALWRLANKSKIGRGGVQLTVEEAVAALDELERTVPADAYRRWRKSVTERRGLRTAAIVAAGDGDFQTAREALRRVRGAIGREVKLGPISGPGGSRWATATYDQAMRMADELARDGRPDLSQEVSDFAAEIAIDYELHRRAARHELKAARAVRTAKQNLVGALLQEARRSYRIGQFSEALKSLDQAGDVRVRWLRQQCEAASELRQKIYSACDPCSVLDTLWDFSAVGEKTIDPARPSRRPEPLFKGARRGKTPGVSHQRSRPSRRPASTSRSQRSRGTPFVNHR